MKVLVLAVLCGFGLLLLAQDEAGYQKAMKTVAGQMGALKKMDSKTGPEAAEAGMKIAHAFGEMKAFWSGKSASDAVELASTGEKAGMELADAAKAGDADKVAASMKTIGGTCGACHGAHREKAADGSFKIK
jgi:cytochrome c556